MLEYPRIKPHLTPVVIPDEGVLLLSEDDNRNLNGQLYTRLVPLLNGEHSTDSLVNELKDAFSPAHVYYGLMQMEKNGHIEKATPVDNPHTAAFWSGLGCDPTSNTSESQIQLYAIGATQTAALQQSLQAMGITASEQATPNAALHVVLTDNYLNPQLQELAQTFRRQQQNWLVIKPVGHEMWLGPYYPADKQGCHACLQKRLKRHRAVETFAAEKAEKPLPSTSRAHLPATDQWISGMAATEIARMLAGCHHNLDQALISVDAYTFTTERHQLIHHPHCPVCGETAAKPIEPVTLQANRADFIEDGGYRRVDPQQTMARYQQLVSSITGIVSHLTPAPTNQVAGVTHVYIAGHNPAAFARDLKHLKSGLRHSSAGKGKTDIQAKVSALCEAIERYSGELQGNEVRHPATLTEMRDRHGDEVIAPNEIMHFSDDQYTNREQINARGSKFNRIAEPLPEDQVIDWTPVWSLTHQRFYHLATQQLYYRTPATEGVNREFAVGCSNGCASGNCLEEAILQGFFELIERDAVAVWWYNRLARPRVAIETFEEPWLSALENHYQSVGREMWALDLTHDFNIPVFVAISRRVDGKAEQPLMGLGCHLDPRMALQRAFAEMNQMLGMEAAAMDESGTGTDDEVENWLRHATLENQPYLAPAHDLPATTLADCPREYSRDLLTDIETCQKKVEERGMQMLVQDQTREDTQMPVARVIVPGLRHFWARFGAGRLYEVPVTLGWLEQPKTEEQLNPIAIFF